MMGLAKRLATGGRLSDRDLLCLLQNRDDRLAEALYAQARAVRDRTYGRRVFLRGLVEISNHCRNNCLYCGIRRGNTKAERYRMAPEDIVSCCESGYATGLRTFVLQGGEDCWFTDEVLCDLIARIKQQFPDCAVTLSLGERELQSYRRLFSAGADRYLLRHETADSEHYASLHPPEMSFDRRMECLRELRAIGYQVGCGFMVGTPGQTLEHLVRDLAFIRDFAPHMVGIGPFLPHRDTPFAAESPGSVEMTLYLLAIVRLLVPDALLPATTALGTAAQNGQIQGLMAGANVIMPNLSPPKAREKYTLYDGKKSSGSESIEGLNALKENLAAQGFDTAPHRGDCIRMR